MPGIDELISKSLTSAIKNNLGAVLEKKVKLDLFKEYGLSINQSISDFSKLDKILATHLKSETAAFEQKCLKEIITLENRSGSFIATIKDKKMVNSMVEILGDKEYRKIIESMLSKPLLISEIIETLKLPKTSAYRKINFLIRNGFLIGVSKEFTKKRRSIQKYTTLFQKINFEMNTNQSFVKLSIPLKAIEQSSSIQIINPSTD